MNDFFYFRAKFYFYNMKRNKVIANVLMLRFLNRKLEKFLKGTKNSWWKKISLVKKLHIHDIKSHFSLLFCSIYITKWSLLNSTSINLNIEWNTKIEPTRKINETRARKIDEIPWNNKHLYVWKKKIRKFFMKIRRRVRIERSNGIISTHQINICHWKEKIKNRNWANSRRCIETPDR